MPESESDGWLLHQDNASAHMALSVKQFLTSKSITVMERPSYSPVIEEVVDLAGKINLDVVIDDVQELLDSHNQELAIEELTEMHEQDIKELESLDPVQSEDQMAVGNLTEKVSV
ncbi:hypothetical protein TNCV_906441 [Trichonephila clavipes]|nr:hypothetical protein TNCV_906441 [Trichonephila clavipes]